MKWYKVLYYILIVNALSGCDNLESLSQYESKWNNNDEKWFKEKIFSTEKMNFKEAQNFCIRMSNVTGIFYSDFSENIYNDSSYWTDSKKNNFIKNNYIFWNTYSKSCLFMDKEIILNLGELYNDSSIYNSEDVKTIEQSFSVNCK